MVVQDLVHHGRQPQILHPGYLLRDDPEDGADAVLVHDCASAEPSQLRELDHEVQLHVGFQLLLLRFVQQLFDHGGDLLPGELLALELDQLPHATEDDRLTGHHVHVRGVHLDCGLEDVLELGHTISPSGADR